jgi:pimeloyl-ACP methyl ester carboxylesterase
MQVAGIGSMQELTKACSNQYLREERIDIPALILRGSESGNLSLETLDEMLHRNPNAQGHAFKGIGHAPPLMSGNQIAVIIDFLSHG